MNTGRQKFPLWIDPRSILLEEAVLRMLWFERTAPRLRCLLRSRLLSDFEAVTGLIISTATSNK